MDARTPASASATLALVAFAAVLSVASTHGAPALPATTAGTVGEASPTAVSTADEVAAPTSAPTTAPGPIVLGGGPRVVACAQSGDLACQLERAPRELLLYAMSACGAWRASQPRARFHRYSVDSIEGSCQATWMPGRAILAVRPGKADDGGDAVVVVDAAGRTTKVTLLGQQVTGAPAVGNGRAVLCTRAGAGRSLYRWVVGGPQPRRWREGCLPALARDGTLAWTTAGGSARRSAVTTVFAKRSTELLVREIASWRNATVRSMAWTGDDRRIVAVVSFPRRTQVIALDLDGGDDRVLASSAGARLRAYPSTAGSRVLVGRTTATGRGALESHDAETGRTGWSRAVDASLEVAWAPDGGRVLVAQGSRWTILDPVTGRTQFQMPRLGASPGWCCPQ